MFERGGAGEDLPTLTLTASEIGDGISAAQLLVRSGLVPSGKEAKRLIAGGGAQAADIPLTDAGRMFTAAELSEPLKLSAGRKRHALVRLDG